MRCRTARDHFMRNCDGDLSESQRIQLQRHLGECPQCAAWCGEMDECMEMVKGLPEMKINDNFEWNLKRRISVEKSKVMRSKAGSLGFGMPWGLRFVSGAAAMLVISLTGAWLMLGDDDPSPGEARMVSAQKSELTAVPRSGEVRFTETGYPAGIQYVADDYLGDVSLDDEQRQLPFRMASDARVNYLVKENELLRKRVQELQYQNLYLKKMLLSRSSRNSSNR
jgi:hypothetical protein